MKYILLLGNITFHHFEADELALFKTGKENKALVHEVKEVLFFTDRDKAYELADEAESYILLPEFTGEMVFENSWDEVKFTKTVNSFDLDEPNFNYQDLDEDNIKDVLKWVANDELWALIDEKEGGIIGYINHGHIKRITDILNENYTK